MLTKDLSLTLSMAWTIALANFIVVGVCLFIVNYLAKLTVIRGNLLIPAILLLCFLGAWGTNNNIGDLIVLVIFGGIGYLMVRFGLPRPPFIMGFILGNLAETYFTLSTSIYGTSWLYRPGVIILFLLTIMIALYPFFSDRLRKIREQRET